VQDLFNFTADSLHYRLFLNILLKTFIFENQSTKIMEYKNTYRIISLIVSHNPPESLYKLTSQLITMSYKIIIIDSSNIEIYNKIERILKNDKIILIHENHDKGLGNALNYGMRIANKFQYDFLLIMEDDSFFVRDIKNIILDFIKLYNNNDVLYLSDNKASNTNKIEFVILKEKDYIGSNTGVFFSSILAKNINFRSNFFMDQIDIDFQYNIKKIGGNIVLTKNKIIDRLPIGRENKNNINTISNFRFYLLTRNSIILFIERKISIKLLFYIPGYFFKGLISGQNIYYLLIALLNGIKDGIKNNLGITKTLIFFRPDLK